MKSAERQFIKFLFVGGLNTLLTYLSYVFFRKLGASPYICNILGYVIGVTNSFFWNKYWVFAHSLQKRYWLTQLGLFLFTFFVCYSLQLFAFRYLLTIGYNEYLSQLAGMVIYTALNFFLNKVLTFK